MTDTITIEVVEEITTIEDTDGLILQSIEETVVLITDKGEKGDPGGVQSVTGLNTDNTDPFNPIVRLSVDGTTITGAGTPASPLTATGSGGAWGSITGTLSNQTDLQNALSAKVTANSTITGATKTKVTYDAKGLVTAGADATTADINDSSNRRYVTDAYLVILSNTSGTNTGDQTITLTGDVTGSGTGSFAATIANGAVSLAKMADVATATVFYRKTAGTGAPEVQTLTTLKTDLGLTGTNSGDQTITLTGDVTGSGTGSFAATIANDAVTFAKMQNINTARILGRYSASTGDIQEIQLGTNVSLVGDTLTVASYPPSGAAGDVQFADGLGGFFSSTSFNFDYINDILSVNNLTVNTLINGGTLSGNNSGDTPPSGGAGDVQFADGLGGFASNASFNYDTGTDTLNIKVIAADTLTVGGNPVAIVGDNVSIFVNDAGYITGNQSITLSGDVSGTGSTSISVTIGNDKVTFAKMQNIATSRILGRTTAGTGDIEELPIGTGIATFLATPSSANLASAVTDETGSGALVFANSPTLVTPALGTPSSGTLTNCTGLPVSGIASSTSTALGVGSLELGNASDTTLSRSAAGVLAVEGVVIPSISSTNTLTNKRITKRVGTTTSSATPTINTDNVDYYSLTAQTVDITSFTTNLSGTPTDNQTLWISITGTAARAITWGSSFESSTVTLPNTTVSTDRLDVGFVWNAATSKWRCVAVA